MRNSIEPCVYLYIITYLVTYTEGITYLKGISTPKWTTRMVALSKWLDDNNWRLAPYGNHEFTKIFRQYKDVIANKYYEEAPANWTDSSLAKYVQSLFFTSTPGPTAKLLKRDKIKLGKLKLIKEKMQKLEERLGITLETTPTTSEPPTTPYTGISTRFTLTSFFDPDYIFDPNFILREIKRLKRDASNLRFPETRSSERKSKKSKRDTSHLNHIHDKDQVHSCDTEPRQHRNLLHKILLKEESDEKCKTWMNVERLQHGLKGLNIERHKTIEGKNKKQRRFKRTVYGPEWSKEILLNKITSPPKIQVLVKRDLGKIIRRSTKRPHLSRRFKAYSMKRYREDMRLAEMITNLQANITIVPEFLEMSHVLHDLEKNNLSTLVYVHNGIGYFGSVPPDLLTTVTTVSSTKGKIVTYELGATQVLEKHIFDDEKKRSPKLNPADADIEGLNNLEKHIDSLEPKKETEVVSETVTKKTRKVGRTGKKEKTKRNTTSTDALKKTRVKKKSTSKKSILDSLDDSLANTNEVKKRKPRSLSLNRGNHECPSSLLVLPAMFYLLQKEMHLRGKRNVQEKVEPNEIKVEDTSKLGHIGRFKESMKRSKNNFVAYVREKKESLVAIPRRARYVVREMFLDGKFFYQELKELPKRVKKDFEEKKDLLKLVWDMLKIFMPVTEKGEKGGTTPETKIVEDPKQYVKNPDNYITPDLSEYYSTPSTETCTKSGRERTLLHEIKSTKSSIKIEEMKSVPMNSEKHEIVQTKTSVAETTTIGPETKKPSMSREKAKTKPHTKLNLFTNDHSTKKSSEFSSSESSESINHNQPVLITDEPTVLRTYQTKIIGPDSIPENTERGDRKDKEKTKKANKIHSAIEKLNDDKTFDNLSASMKNKDFMDKVLDNADTDRLKTLMGSIKPQDVLAKLDKNTMQKMCKLMTEIDTGTISKMQDIAKKTMNFASPGSDVVKTR